LAVVRKSEFAKIANVTKGNVTHWINAGHISGAALVGEGRTAMIDVELAMAQLKERLSVNERFGLNGLDTNLEAPLDLPVPEVRESEVSPPVAPVVAQLRPAETIETDGTVEARIKAEKLKQAQFLSSRLKLEDAARHGKYMDTQEASGALTRQADEMLKIFEGAFPEFASATAAKFQVPQREMLHLLHEEFRRVREQLSAVCASKAAGTPRTVEVA
jgi:hypothetical protein